MYQRILVPIDGSATAKAGLREAIELARTQRAQLRVLHVIDEYPLAVDLSVLPALDAVRNAMRSGSQVLLDQACQQAASQQVEADSSLRETMDRRVAGAIIDEARAWHADLIVMGTHGRRGVDHLFLGSDAELVIRQSPVPVLLVRHAAERGPEVDRSTT